MFTFDAVYNDIQWLADENPDRRADCVYAMSDDKGNIIHPECIVGHWLHQNDLIYDNEWGEIEDDSSNAVLDMLYKRRNVEIEDSARRFLEAVQRHQDSGSTWREAFFAATAETVASESDNEVSVS